MCPRRYGKGSSEMKVLLVVPDFPIPKKRKIQHDFLPIGLLKIGTYLRQSEGCEVELVFGNRRLNFNPKEIWITSLFTYWSEYVHDSARYYRRQFPKAKLRIGGIYASLMPGQVRNRTGGAVHKGVYTKAEQWCDSHGIDFSLLEKNVNFQILHGMRGCFRRCKFCGTWRIEPKETFNSAITSKIESNHVVFYDNNFLRNPDIKRILRELAEKKVNDRRVHYESQSGFDGRIMDQEIANLIKKAGFLNPRIAWDNSFDDFPRVHQQVQMLVKAGYSSKDIYVFMLFNWNYDFSELEKKRLKCWEWRVQISDCRFRPLDQMYDYFNSRKKQTLRDYYIHPGWTDDEVKQFRSNVRKHNICVRHGFRFYSKALEQMLVSRTRSKKLRAASKKQILTALPDAWFPGEFHGPDTSQSRLEAFNGESDSKALIPQSLNA